MWRVAPGRSVQLWKLAALRRVPGPVASTPAGNLSEMQILELQPKCLVKQKSAGEAVRTCG